MSNPVDPPVPEPVTTVEWWKASIISILLAAVAILGALDVWHPTQDQVTAFATGAAALVAIVFPIIAQLLRKKVTPNSNVALTVKQADVLHALATPAPVVWTTNTAMAPNTVVWTNSNHDFTPSTAVADPDPDPAVGHP